MHLPVSIPEPCHEQWDNMQARGNGRHCNACQKTVVDFTGWEAGDILAYLKSNKQTCGRFTADQLQVQAPPAPVPAAFSWWPSVMSSGLSRTGKIAAAVLLLFHLASCGTANEKDNNRTTSQVTAITSDGEDTDHTNDMLGGIAIMGDTVMPTVPPSPPKPQAIPGKHPEPVLVGEPVMVTDSPVVAGPEAKPQIMGGVMIVPQQDSLPGIPE